MRRLLALGYGYMYFMIQRLGAKIFYRQEACAYGRV